MPSYEIEANGVQRFSINNLKAADELAMNISRQKKIVVTVCMGEMRIISYYNGEIYDEQEYLKSKIQEWSRNDCIDECTCFE